MTYPSQPRVLIVADNASARFGGEAILPLKYFTLLARRGRDVRLITHERNRAGLEELAPDLADRITYSPDTALHRWLWRIGARFPGAIRDHLFGNLMGLATGVQQRRLARGLITAGQVDLVHQPIPVSPAAPSLLHGLGVPVVIGPMNGGMSYPPGYEDFEGRASRLFVGVGRPLAGLVNRLIPGKRRAALLLVANQRTAKALPVSGPPVVELVENAVDFSLWPQPVDAPRDEGPLRLVFMGRLIRLKALDSVLTALVQTARPVTLAVLGDGPERAALEAQTRALGLTGRVTFHGFLPQTACAAHLAGADALILPSLRECGGAVVLEAMAMGRAVIASDWGGPADYLDPTCGILVPPAPREGFAQRLTMAIDILAADPAQARAMGQAGAAKVRSDYDWQKKIDTIEALYTRALS
ncbi:glycosyltransferase family 4 protein [Pararhodobacter zhoushanensis]|uniref:Glycosyltransferase family 4 protein n=1 Tax=Pararhodobacter zhoushanensis TaxID=2479545 RepID=A0ABT3GWE6_9RHOB|nr:glycosyltransferase family 4 protein [Pararhodobacter zhoushanensis]MCW1931874.1 glycosyltransferase family 4 protein [Pararhodobacter zhoushanensis]